jgi:hypothetical protein
MDEEELPLPSRDRRDDEVRGGHRSERSKGALASRTCLA